MKATEDDLLDVLSQEALIERAKLTRDATLENLGVDSLDMISMLFVLEERYGVVIEEGDMPQMSTLGELTDFLLSKINAEPAEEAVAS